MVESASSLPWLWAIQSVASCKQIHISILQALIRAAPVARADFCGKTRELIALRCLEEIFDSAHRVGCDEATSASLDSRVRFDFSSSCEDVLQKILDEIPLPNLEMDGAKLLKWNVFPFIMHKRGTIKCDLQQLKESIVEGTHPYADHLRDISGLLHQNENTVHVNDNVRDDLRKRDHGNHNYCENMGAKENPMFAILEKVNESSKESLLDKIIPCKRNRAESADEHVMGYQLGKQVDISECDEVNAKKSRCSSLLNVDSDKEKSVPPHGKQVIENHTDKVVRENLGVVSEEGSHDQHLASIRCKSSNQNEVSHREPQASISMKHTSDIEYCQQQNDEPVKTKVLLRNEVLPENGDNTAHKALNVIHELQSKRKTGAQGNEPNAADDKAGGAVILSDGDEYQNEKLGLAAQKCELLSSRCTSGHDISTSTRLTENNVCMKCKEGGKLLVCRTTTCPIMVHESCLTTCQIDAEGNFLCPFCVYYQAISRCVEAKKKASLARKELASFIRI
ncbi:uncharacterized protein LOC130933383 [Arachis stenosperma]|uniref:uncharacterized protein LOC130933383 n=1 Tax=Arachis stenosperma TaxID=217475 RepID=UPI0025ACAC87|nr:uncharacterized protein LOC130933383 [Arachis stenosperma]